MNGSTILFLGVAYKQDIDDYRESPAIRVIEQLQAVGADVSYYDPWVPMFKENGVTMYGEPALSEKLLKQADLVMITCAHSNVDYSFVQKHAKAIFDTKNVMKKVTPRNNIEVL